MAESEDALLEQVLSLAKVQGWRAHHQRPCRTAAGWKSAIQGDAGFPDLVLVRPPRLVVAELKSQSGRFGDGQEPWLDALARCAGPEVYVWRPEDWEEIVMVLAR